jgi:Holliday junction resolvasome RuvABC endonuclease subunit
MVLGDQVRTVIGLDPSYQRTGAAVWREGRVATFSVATSVDDGPRVKRQRIIAGRVFPLVSERLFNTEDGLLKGSLEAVVMIEAVHMKRLKGRTPLDLAGLHDVLVYGFHARQITVGVVYPQGPKVMATSKGNASKTDMVDAALSELGLQVGNSDEADALWLMVMGVVAGGGTVRGWGGHALEDKARQRAMAKVEWIGSFEPDWLKG